MNGDGGPFGNLLMIVSYRESDFDFIARVIVHGMEGNDEISVRGVNRACGRTPTNDVFSVVLKDVLVSSFQSFEVEMTTADSRRCAPYESRSALSGGARPSASSWLARQGLLSPRARLAVAGEEILVGRQAVMVGLQPSACHGRLGVAVACGFGGSTAAAALLGFGAALGFAATLGFAAALAAAFSSRRSWASARPWVSRRPWASRRP